MWFCYRGRAFQSMCKEFMNSLSFAVKDVGVFFWMFLKFCVALQRLHLNARQYPYQNESFFN